MSKTRSFLIIVLLAGIAILVVLYTENSMNTISRIPMESGEKVRSSIDRSASSIMRAVEGSEREFKGVGEKGGKETSIKSYDTGIIRTGIMGIGEKGKPDLAEIPNTFK